MIQARTVQPTHRDPHRVLKITNYSPSRLRYISSPRGNGAHRLAFMPRIRQWLIPGHPFCLIKFVPRSDLSPPPPPPSSICPWDIALLNLPEMLQCDCSRCFETYRCCSAFHKPPCCYFLSSFIGAFKTRLYIKRKKNPKTYSTASSDISVSSAGFPCIRYLGYNRQGISPVLNDSVLWRGITHFVPQTISTFIDCTSVGECMNLCALLKSSVLPPRLSFFFVFHS